MALVFSESYTLGDNNGVCSGIVIDNNNLDDYFLNRVKNRYYDIEGTQELIEEFSDVATTDFEFKELNGIFSSSPTLEPWQIGEAFSECFLEDYKNSRFPYPYSRDSKNPKSSLAGADLVGFFYLNDMTLFLFGEVKTSSENQYPPQVVTSRSGLKKQLEDLRSCNNIRHFLIMWLGHKMKNLKEDDRDKQDYKKALASYLAIREQIKIVGVLIRDVEPNKKDFESRFNTLKNNLHSKMHMELLAFYFPIQITTFPGKIGDNVT